MPPKDALLESDQGSLRSGTGVEGGLRGHREQQELLLLCLEKRKYPHAGKALTVLCSQKRGDSSCEDCYGSGLLPLSWVREQKRTGHVCLLSESTDGLGWGGVSSRCSTWHSGMISEQLCAATVLSIIDRGNWKNNITNSLISPPMTLRCPITYGGNHIASKASS